MADRSTKRFIFPRWANYLLPVAVVGALGSAFYLPTIVGFGFSPKTLAVGYAPEQPIPYSHALHAGQLGIDCRYCHSTVDRATFAAIPPTQVCMNCHTNIRNDSAKLTKLRESWTSGKPVAWVKVHDLADYVYFNHSAHVNKGVSCVSCHGRIDQMEQVFQAQPLSMGWCLDCHREPEKALRPRDQVTNLAWKPSDLQKTNPEIFQQVQAANPGQPVTQEAIGGFLKSDKGYKIHDAQYMTSCSTCHR